MNNANRDPLSSSSRENRPGQNWNLVESNGKLGLVDPAHPEQSAITIEFPAYLASARGRSELASLPLIRAMGKKARQIVDATAGMGQDCFALAVFGFSVVAIERSDKIAALLKDALQRAQTDDELNELLGDRLQVVPGDAIKELKRMAPAPEVVYLDPMYPPKRKKSALAKKEMQVLRALVGDDDDAQLLFEVARSIARDRVVVKRPIYAEPISPEPSMSYESKLVRFDVYLNNRVNPEAV